MVLPANISIGFQGEGIGLNGPQTCADGDIKPSFE
jgi:hypothetical protein